MEFDYGDELRKLGALTKATCTSIMDKLHKKLNEGYYGWDTMSVDHLRDNLIAQLEKGTTPDDYIDIINYAMFIRAGLIAGDDFDEKPNI